MIGWMDRRGWNAVPRRKGEEACGMSSGWRRIGIGVQDEMHVCGHGGYGLMKWFDGCGWREMAK